MSPIAGKHDTLIFIPVIQLLLPFMLVEIICVIAAVIMLAGPSMVKPP